MEPFRCISSTTYCISAVNTQHMQRPVVLVQLGYIWRYVSAVNRPTKNSNVKVQSNRFSNEMPLSTLKLETL